MTPSYSWTSGPCFAFSDTRIFCLHSKSHVSIRRMKFQMMSAGNWTTNTWLFFFLSCLGGCVSSVLQRNRLLLPTLYSCKVIYDRKNQKSCINWPNLLEFEITGSLFRKLFSPFSWFWTRHFMSQSTSQLLFGCLHSNYIFYSSLSK